MVSRFLFNFFLLFVVCITVFTACQSSSGATSEAPASLAKQSLHAELTWTAYKFTNKTPVVGRFKEIRLMPVTTEGDILEQLSKLNFSIPVNSISTDNEERDTKILLYFFGNLRSANEIYGEIDWIDTANQRIVVSLTLNEVEQDITMDYTLTPDGVSMKGTLDLGQFEAYAGLEGLNKVCEALHKGPDGVSKLWDVVDLQILIRNL